ncbi:MAG TPA: hypothetical protein PK812_10760 [Beijerinckiaceae bacterium]|nr:hypothetical protein [Beijerinckiaceae bacterium]
MHLFSSFARKVIALAVIGAGLAVSVAPAEAQWRRKGVRPGVVAAAAVGGLAAGALIASASRPAYGAPVYGYPQYNYAPHAGVTYYSQPTYYAPAYSAPVYSAPVYAPSYATPVVRYHRPRPVYRRYAAYEPVCTITRKKVWLGPNTYTFRRATVCR